MHFLHPLFAVLLVLAAVLLVRVTFGHHPDDTVPGHFVTIDGLRGYLAFFVFLHHAAIWFTYSRTQVWTAPASNVYTHLGQSSVALFFMITSFLFHNKLLRVKFGQFAWRSFFVGRFFRLAPLYGTAMLGMFLIVAILSHWTLNEQPPMLFLGLLRWLVFTVPGAPVINHVNPAPIVAGVMWSLPYEWCFYFVLPLIALTTGQRPPGYTLAIAVVALLVAWTIHMEMQYASTFVGGMIAAQLVRHAGFRQFCTHPWASALALLCLATVLIFPTVYQVIPYTCLTGAFCLIAGGADVFGVLRTRTSRKLGELAYSIYLLHGMLLFLMIHFVVGTEKIAAMSGPVYWMAITLLVPFLLGLSALAFRYIEQPGIDFGKKWAAARSTRHAAPDVTSP